MAAPTVVRTVSSSGTATSITLSTLLVDGLNTLLLVTAGVGAATSRDITNVTHHGLACSPEWTGTDSNFVQSEGWYRIAPDAGTWDVVITGTGGSFFQMGAGATLINGAHQSTPFGTPTTGGAVDNANTINVASAADEIVISGTATDDDDGLTAGQTQLWQAVVNGDTTFGGQWAAGAASVTMAWTQTIVGWGSGGVSIKGAPPSGPPPPTTADIFHYPSE